MTAPRGRIPPNRPGSETPTTPVRLPDTVHRKCLAAVDPVDVEGGMNAEGRREAKADQHRFNHPG